MATFALNARKWKHDDGGWIDEEFTLPYSAYIADRVNNMGLNNSQKAAVYSSIYGESRFNPYAYNPRDGGKEHMESCNGEVPEYLKALICLAKWTTWKIHLIV